MSLDQIELWARAHSHNQAELGILLLDAACTAVGLIGKDGAREAAKLRKHFERILDAN